jgi:general secretion pathway protein J
MTRARLSTGSLQRGFTLLEILVAVAIFGIVAYMSYSGLDAVIRQHEIVSESATRLRNLQYAMRRLVQDFSQIQPRAIREETGEGLNFALIADTRTTEPMELTRAGWHNPLAHPRSSLQRVAYWVEEDILIRAQWPVLDRMLGEEPIELELLEGIDEFQLLFLDANNEWIEQWPPPDQQNSGPDGQSALPQAIEIILQLDDWGEIRRIVELAG